MNNENWALLKAEIIKKGKTVNEVAATVGIDPITLLRKGKGTSDFKRSELQAIRTCLDLTDKEFDRIFFA